MIERGWLKSYASALVCITGIVDIVLLVVSGFVSGYIKFASFNLNVLYYWVILTCALLVPIIFSFFKVYSPLRGRYFYRHVKRIFFAILTIMILLMVFVFAFRLEDYFSRIWLFYWGVISFILLVAFRFTLNMLFKWLREHGFNQRDIIVIGAGTVGKKVAEAIKESAWSGFRIFTFMDDDKDLQIDNIKDIPVIGIPNNLDSYIKANEIDEIWVALPLTAINRVGKIAFDLRYSTTTIRMVPDFFALNYLLNHSIVEIANVPVVNIRTSPMIGINRWVKAIEDRALALIILTLISPLLLVIAIVVKLSSPGPVFYRQRRVSWNGIEFEMLKFRSMPVGTEAKTGAVWAKACENRATKIGSFLRKTSLDELPQFINVLKGDMSIVGPRPERPVFVEQFKQEIPRYMQKHLVKAGITGWAQINGWRGNTDLSKRIEYDLYYIENWSLWFDLKIIFATFFSGFINKNAY